MGLINTVVKRLNPDSCAVQARAQGSTDPDAPWSRARYNQIQQYRLRLRQIRFRDLSVVDQLKPHFQGLFSLTQNHGEFSFF